MSNYAEKLKHPKWQKKRLSILSRDKFTCRLCKDTETTLHVHHKYYIQAADPWDYPGYALITLCEHCHMEVERFKDEITDFDSVKIYKSNRWVDGGRIMYFTNSETGFCTMRLFEKNGDLIIGYTLSVEERKRVMAFLKASLKFI